MSKPRFTDTARFVRPYVPAEQSKEEGYLARRFAEIRAEQERNTQEAARKVATMKKQRAA